MTPQAQRIAIAEACGWTKINVPLGQNWGQDGSGKQWWYVHQLPDYLSDLNAMHSAEWAITDEQHAAFRMHLRDLCKENNIHTTATKRRYASSTAAHRAEAFLRTLNLWDDTK